MQSAGPRTLQEVAGELWRERKRAPHLTVARLRAHWAAIVGADLARKTSPLRLQGGTLWIAAVDSSWAYQLQFLSGELLQSVRVFLDASDIADLRFRAAPLPSCESPRRETPPACVPLDSLPVSPALELAASAIADPALRAAFVRAVAKQTARAARPSGAATAAAPG